MNQQIVNLLNETNIQVNYKRKNSGKGRSKTLGIVFNRSLLRVHHNIPDCHVPSVFTKENPELYDMIFKFGRTFVKHDFSSVQVNKNYQCERHIDGKNNGISTIIGLGDYEGGELIIEKEHGNEIVNIKDNPVEFDGSKFYHSVTPISSGTRYSLVFFDNNHK